MKRIAMAVGCLGAVHAQAQGVSWETVKEAVLTHPGLGHELRKVEERRTEGSRAGQAPVLRAELELENFAGTGGAAGLGGSSLGLWAAGDYRLGAVREREKDLAASGLALQEIGPLRLKRELLREARQVWESWQEERWRANLMDTFALEASALAVPLEAGRKVGRIGPWEVTSAQAQSAQWQHKAQAHRHKARLLWLRLGAWGVPGAEPEVVGEPDSLRWRARPDQATNLDSLTLERERSRALAQAALLEAQDRPVLSGAVGVLRDQSTGDAGLGMRVSLPLPPWKRTGLETVKARHEAAALEREIQLERRERQMRLRGIKEELVLLRSDLERWEGQVMPPLAKAKELAEASRATGAIDAAAVWPLRKELLEARSERLEMLLRVRELQRDERNLEGVEP